MKDLMLNWRDAMEPHLMRALEIVSEEIAEATSRLVEADEHEERCKDLPRDSDEYQAEFDVFEPAREKAKRDLLELQWEMETLLQTMVELTKMYLGSAPTRGSLPDLHREFSF